MDIQCPLSKQMDTKKHQRLKEYGCTEIYTDLDDAIISLEPRTRFFVPDLISTVDTIKKLYELIQRVHDMDSIFVSLYEDIYSITKEGEYFIKALELVLEYEKQHNHLIQQKAIQEAKDKGIRFGRRPKLNKDDVLKALELKEYGYSNSMVANRFDVSKSTLLRHIANYKAG